MLRLTRPLHTLLVALGVVALVAVLVVAPGSPGRGASTGPAPGAPGEASTWVPGDKDGFGTAYGTRSKVWFTLSRGSLNEVYYPRIDTPSLRDSLFVVSDGRTFTDREDQDAVSRVRLLDPRSLTFRMVTTDKSGDWRLTKTFVADPARHSVLQRIRFESLTGRALQLYLLHDPALNMTGNDDTGSLGGRGALLSTDGEVSSAVLSSPAMTSRSNGYLGQSDGWTDIASDHRMDWEYATAAEPGNLVQTARVPLTGLRGKRVATLAIGFADTPAQANTIAAESLDAGFADRRRAYVATWHRYLDSVRSVPTAVQWAKRQWDMSAMVLAASEDKTYRGGFVAAPGRPWAWANELQDLAVYHAVWSRDLYQIATGLLAVGDRAAANRALSYLWRHQQRADGSFPQNSRLDGTPVFGGLQMDEVALPIVLAYQLGRDGAASWDHVRRAADFIVANGPDTEQERWENIGGYSPNTIAAEIAGLVCAARIARTNGDDAAARRYLATADEWRSKVKSWTATPNGPYHDDRYYLRVTANGDPDQGTEIQISDGGPLIDQRRVVDPSFLDLVRLGVQSADDRTIRTSLAVVDRQLRYRTANGLFWHRASFDGYGEMRDGTQWEPVPTGSGQTLGRGWPLLSGERGEYALLAGRPKVAGEMLTAMAASADDRSYFLPEQVWDHRRPAGTKGGPTPGEPTRSAMPLAWTHAQFLRLAAGIAAGTPIEVPQAVACRYETEGCTR